MYAYFVSFALFYFLFIQSGLRFVFMFFLEFSRKINAKEIYSESVFHVILFESPVGESHHKQLFTFHWKWSEASVSVRHRRQLQRSRTWKQLSSLWEVRCSSFHGNAPRSHVGSSVATWPLQPFGCEGVLGEKKSKTFSTELGFSTFFSTITS